MDIASEVAANRTYVDQARTAPDEKSKKALLGIAADEADHYRILKGMKAKE